MARGRPLGIVAVLVLGCGRTPFDLGNAEADTDAEADGSDGGSASSSPGDETTAEESTESGTSTGSDDGESSSSDSSDDDGRQDLPVSVCGDGVPAEDVADLCFGLIPLDDGWVSDVALIHFDDEEDLDIVYTTQDGAFLLLGMGDGTFDGPIDLDIPGVGLSVEVTWLDNPIEPENRRDLVITTTEPGALVTMLAIGDDPIGLPTSYPAGSWPLASARGFLDGDPVLISANGGETTLGFHVISTEGVLLPALDLPIGLEPVTLSFSFAGWEQPPALGPWTLAVADQSGRLELWDILLPPIEQRAVFQLDHSVTALWTGTFSDTGSGRVLVTAPEIDELRLYGFEDTIELHASAVWPGEPVAMAWNSLGYAGLAVALHTADAIGLATFCSGRACVLEDPMLIVDTAPRPRSIVTGNLNGDGEDDIVVGSLESGLTLLLSNP